MSTSSECPICGGVITAEHPIMGELIYCADCSSELEVIGISPLQLQEAPGEGEDWGE